MAASQSVAASTARVAKIRDTLSTELSNNFAGTLGQEGDIVNIVMALFFYESSFNVTRFGPVNPSSSGTGRDFISSSVVTAVLQEGNPTKRTNIENCLRGIGLGQVVGWNFVRGGSSTGKCEIERLRPDLAPDLLIEAGEDIFSVILGEANMVAAIRASLIILEGKYRNSYFTGSAYQGRGDFLSRKFPTRISAAVAGYLGYGVSDINKTTPEVYSSRIIGGDIYVKANGGGIKVQDTVLASSTATGPSTNGTGQKPVGIPGCG